MGVIPTHVIDINQFKTAVSGLLCTDQQERNQNAAKLLEMLYNISEEKVHRITLINPDSNAASIEDLQRSSIGYLYKDLKSGAVALSMADAEKLVSEVAKAAADGNINKQELKTGIMNQLTNLNSTPNVEITGPKQPAQDLINGIKPSQLFDKNGLPNRVGIELPY